MPTRTQTTLVAMFRDRSDAQAAVSELEANGFAQDEIYLNSSNSGTGSTTSEPDYSRYDASARHEGGISGWFKRIFGQEDDQEQTHYESAVRSGNTMLSVDTNDENVDKAAEILNRHSPVDIHVDPSGPSQAQASAAAQTRDSEGNPAARGVPQSGSQAIPVIQEDIQVGKRSVVRGGVRVYSRVVDQPVEETVRLRDEKVRVDRQPVNRPATAADLSGREEQVIEVAEYAEEPVVSKQARVVEEVRVGKEANERTQTVRDNVRRTEVKVENIPGQTGARTGAATTATAAGRDTEFDEQFRTHYNTAYGTSGTPYETYAPAYRYGYEAASDPRYQGRSYEDVESDLRSDYGRRYPNSTWDKTKDAVRYGWDRVTGKTRGAGSAR